MSQKSVPDLMLGVALFRHFARERADARRVARLFGLSHFSIAAIDPRTGEVGAAVTTRVPCVGNAACPGCGRGRRGRHANNTRTEYGNELLDALARGKHRPTRSSDSSPLIRAPRLARLASSISGARSAQHTGTSPQPWADIAPDPTYVTQGKRPGRPEVIEAVAMSFEASEGMSAISADRLIDAIAAGHALGGTGRRIAPVRRGHRRRFAPGSLSSHRRRDREYLGMREP